LPGYYDAGFTGIDLANEIRGSDKTAPILFFTSSAEFALESYSVRAADYVLKPVSKEKLFLTFDELLEQIEAQKRKYNYCKELRRHLKNISFKYSLCRGHWKKCVVSLDIRKSCGMHGAFFNRL